MKRLIALLLAMLCLFSCAVAEEEYGPVTQGDPATIGELTELIDPAPYIPEDLEKTVFGADDRTTINQTGKYPYSAIAYLIVKGKCGCEWTGSGFLIGKSAMATAAHCLICKEHGDTPSGITMYFGYKSNKNYAYRYNGGATFWYGANPFVDGRYIADDDYAYLKLEKPVGEKMGTFGIRYPQDGARYTLTGYRHGVLKTSSGAIERSTEKLLFYKTDTEPGNSGCPLYDSEYYAVAINVGYNDTYNFARRFTTDVVSEMYDHDLFD